MTKKEEYKSFMNFMLILYDFFHRTVDLFMQYSAYLKSFYMPSTVLGYKIQRARDTVVFFRECSPLTGEKNM